MRKDIIRTKLKEIDESLILLTNHLPDTFDDFSKLGLVKDGIYKKLEFCIEMIFDICAIINADLKFGVPESDENILDNLVKNKVINNGFGTKIILTRS